MINVEELYEDVRQELLIYHCFSEQAKDMDGVNFSLEQYREFWVNNKTGDEYILRNRNGSTLPCKVAYYPLSYYKDLRALIEINMGEYNDYREVPVIFLKKKEIRDIPKMFD